MAGAALLLAQAAGDPLSAIPDWVDTVGAVGALALVLGLWLRGTLMRRADHQQVVEAQEGEIAALEARLAAVMVDRDAWRAAHGEEVKARVAAEAAAAKLIDSSNMSVQLLGALRDALHQGRPHQ